MNDVVTQLLARGYPIQGALITYFSVPLNIYTYIAKEPLSESHYVPLADFSKRLSIRCRIPPKKDVKQEQQSGIQADKPAAKKEHNKRNKERKIVDIIDKVSKWRQLYSGTVGLDGKIQKCSLEEAATKVGVAKKTLDDYLLQLRAGKKYGFDFNANKESKVGVLRTFVKQAKHQDKGGNATNDANNPGNCLICITIK
jgi:hypothetical protein